MDPERQSGVEEDSTIVEDRSDLNLAAELTHAHPGFTVHTYQHLLPGMGAAAAHQEFSRVASSSVLRQHGVADVTANGVQEVVQPVTY